MEKEYEKLEEASHKDEKLLVAKNTAIYELVKQNDGLKKILRNMQGQKTSRKNSGLSEKDLIDNSMVD